MLNHKERKGLRKREGFTFGIAPKVTKGLGPKPPKAEKPSDIPKIRKLATLKQYGFLNGIPPGFSPAERFFRQRPGGYGDYEGLRGLYLPPLFHNASTTPIPYTFYNKINLCALWQLCVLCGNNPYNRLSFGLWLWG